MELSLILVGQFLAKATKFHTFLTGCPIVDKKWPLKIMSVVDGSLDLETTNQDHVSF